MHLCRVFLASLIVGVACGAVAQRGPTATSPIHDLVQPNLVADGSTPFHLKAVITKGHEGTPYAEVEMYWMAPQTFRRTIHAQDFNQTLVVNGSQTFEEDSTPYFPLDLWTLVTAMVNPGPILAAIRQGDRVLTKANGDVNDNGVTCFNAARTLCGVDRNGLRETVAASGHPVDFSRYEKFGGKKVARELTTTPRLGEPLMTLSVTKLEDLKSPDQSLFAVTQKTPTARLLRFEILDEPQLRANAASPQQIVWPQPLDGAEHGPASFYISIDQDGNVREVKQLYTVNERTNESAIHQISRWKFKPFLNDGLPTQAEGVLTFTLDTRAWGPKEPLTDAEVRKLASHIVVPVIDGAKYPKGTIYTLSAAIDSDGHLIEVIAGDGPHELFNPCYDSLKQWAFNPIIGSDGKALPYRANIVFPIN